MVEFAGFSMPVHFTSVLKEHLCVRESCGLFDVSHMGFLEWKGGHALGECDKLLPTNLIGKPSGQAIYSVLLNEQGKAIDDLIVYVLDAQHLFMVVNASRIVEDMRWFEQHCQETEIVHDTRTCILAVQGPQAETILEKVLDADLHSLPYMHFQRGQIGKWQLMLARTGYTGADGFELMVRDELAQSIVEECFQEGVLPCGLGARDSLRLEAGYRLYGQDLDEETSPLEAGLSFVVDWEKEFIGKEALLKEKEAGLSKKFIGFVMQERGIPRHGYPLMNGEAEIGAITSGGYSPLLKKGIGIGFVSPEKDLEKLGVLIHNKIRAAEKKRPPFVPLGVKRTKRSTAS